MVLKEYIKRYIVEAFSHDKLSAVVDALNSIVEKDKGSDRDYALYYDLVKVTDRFGMKCIGSGAYRRVYAMPGEDWVLKFSISDDGSDKHDESWANAEEIAISAGDHGLGARDLFVQVYDWDKISEEPKWTIVQKVMTLSSASRHVTISDLSKIFPTFWSALYNDARHRSSVDMFCDYVTDTLNELSIERHSNQNSRGLSEEDFYSCMKEASWFDNMPQVKTFEEIRFGEDFRRIARACAYSRPEDMHSGNIGIVPSSNPNPQDLVILDYMIDS